MHRASQSNITDCSKWLTKWNVSELQSLQGNRKSTEKAEEITPGL